MMDAGWKEPQVARAQRMLVEKQLVDPERAEPFAAFLKIMKEVPWEPGHKFLDVGCGVGHYGILLRRYFPGLVYTGIDSSTAMIEQAKFLHPEGGFCIRGCLDAPYWDYDIVLASQVFEFLENPWEGLRYLVVGAERLRKSSPASLPNFLILHRLRVTPGPSGRSPIEPTYCGHSAPNYFWNISDVESFLNQYGATVFCSLPWSKNITLAVRI